MIIKVNQLIFFFVSQHFLKEKENMFSVSSYQVRNICERLGELKNVWKHWPAAHVHTAFLDLPNFYFCFYNSREMQYMCSISYIIFRTHKSSSNYQQPFKLFAENLHKNTLTKKSNHCTVYCAWYMLSWGSHCGDFVQYR